MSGRRAGVIGAIRACVVSASLVGAAAGALVATAGCASDPTRGYVIGPTTPTEVRTVRIEVFDNATFETGLETRITEAVIKEVQRSTPIRVVQDLDADTRLVGVVRSAELRRLSVDRTTGLVQEMAYQVTVDFDWLDERTGKALVSRRGFSAADTFVPSRPTGERLETGEAGVAERLARDIVATMRSRW